MPDIEHIRGEIERMRTQVHGSAAKSSNCNGREYPKRQRTPSLIECWISSTLFAPSATGSRKGSPWRPEAKPSVVGAGDARTLKWYERDADNPPWIKALADVRHLAVVMRAEALSRKGHVGAVALSRTVTLLRAISAMPR
jgi:hypothetical protein